MITADFANDFNREVGAVPGRIEDPMSCGCNNLIQTNRAHLVTSGTDLAVLAGWDDGSEDAPSGQAELFADLTDVERLVVELMDRSNGTDIDDLIRQSKLSASQLATVLLSLELKGVVRPLPGKRYARIN